MPQPRPCSDPWPRIHDPSCVRRRPAPGQHRRDCTAPARSRRGSKKAEDGTLSKEPAAISSPVDYKTIVAALLSALGDQDDAVRAAAAAALGAAGPKVSPEPQEQLVAALKDQFATTRAAAAKALPRFERGLDPVIPVLVKLAADDQNVHDACPGPARTQAIGHLGRRDPCADRGSS